MITKHCILTVWEKKACNDAPCGFEPTRARNSWVRVFKSYWSGRVYSFRFVRTPTWNARVLNELIGQYEPISTNILRSKIVIDIYTFSRISSQIIMLLYTSVHSSTGMAPASVMDSDVLAIWKKLQKKRKRLIKAKYSVGQHVVSVRRKPNSRNPVNKILALKYFGLPRCFPGTRGPFTNWKI